MGSRGVTRPMAEMQMQGGHEQHDGGGEKDGEHDGDHGHGEPYSKARYHMLHMHHQQTLWIYWTVILLGFWTLLAPFTFGYLDSTQWVRPSGGRGPWFSDDLHTALRAWLMTWSDILSGLLLIFFGWRSLQPNRPVSMWAACFVGVWLTFAPLFFWSPSSAAYLNDSFVGMLVIALTVLIPGMPNMIVYMRMGGSVPPGWSYNPSSWPQRWIMIVTGFAGFLVSRYLGVFQLGYINTAWDPFFGDSSRQVLNSKMSHMWPISDGGFGALAYTFEFLMGWMGSPARWRTMPWMVTFFGILVIPLGLVHIALVISQPVFVGHWCTFCLLAAAIMLPMIPLEVDEVVAMIQHLKRSKKKGESLWTVFWKGGDPEESTEDERSPEIMELPEKPRSVFFASIWGMSFPWTLTVSTAFGIGIMFVPALFGLTVQSPLANLFHVGGALVVVVSVIAMGEVLRIGRYLNVPIGLALMAIPWLVGDANIAVRLTGLVAGVLVIFLALPKGPQTEHYGTWDRWVR